MSKNSACLELDGLISVCVLINTGLGSAFTQAGGRGPEIAKGLSAWLPGTGAERLGARSRSAASRAPSRVTSPLS